MSAMCYPWQQVVLDAFMPPADRLPAKIEAAKEAITRRLQEQPEADERTTLCDALIDLKALSLEVTEFASYKTGHGVVDAL